MQKIASAAHAPVNWSFLLLIAFFIAIYAPLIMHGGIIVDDWGDIAHNLDCNGFAHCYQTWFPLFSNRPLAPLPITVATFLFGTFFSGYLILNTAVYLAAILITRRVVAQYIGDSPSIIFALLAAIPFIAMPVIASPINQLTATVSFLLWALSILELSHFLNTSSKRSYALTYIYLLLAFLTYEVILPLLVFTALLPFIANDSSPKKNWLKYFLRFILPIGLVLAAIILWQKGIAPHFMDVDSRLKLNPQQMLAKLHTWGHVFYAQIPNLFSKAPAFFTPYQIFASILLTLSIALGFKSAPKDQTKASTIYRFLFVSIMCFLASSSIFILSDESANSWGYQARGLSSTWFSLCILLAAIAALRIWPVTILVAVFGIASSISFSIQRDNYIQSWQTQMLIIKDVIDLSRKSEIPKNSIIIGDVPKFVSPNYNDEIVFSQPWDFGAALAIFTKQHIRDGAVIDSRNRAFNNITASKDSITINGWWVTTTDNLWFYEFNPDLRNGKLSKIQSTESFKSKLNDLGYQTAP